MEEKKNIINQNTILVSICCITYNHANYIEETLNSIVSQEFNFPIEILIHDDCSTDGTREILLQFKEKSHQEIKLYFPNENRWSRDIDIFPILFNNARGKYISICEGDDYWLGNNKLKEQIDFLENNQEYNLISGQAKQFIQNSNKFIEPKKITSYTFNYKDMILRNHCITCTTTIRNVFKGELKTHWGWGMDSQYWILVLGKKSLGFKSDKIWGVYRRHDQSFTAITNKARKDYNNIIGACKRKIKKARFWNDYFGNNANKEVLQVEHKFKKRMLSLALKRRKIWDIPTFALQYLIVKLKQMIA